MTTLLQSFFKKHIVNRDKFNPPKNDDLVIIQRNMDWLGIECDHELCNAIAILNINEVNYCAMHSREFLGSLLTQQ